MTAPSCLSCEHSRPYAPPGTRAQIKHRCTVFLFDVDGSTIPGATIRCDRFTEPSVPFAFEDADEMPAYLL